MEDAVHALMMAFAVIVFVIAFTISMYMFSQITSLAETLTLYADTTLFYDNIDYESGKMRDEDGNIINKTTRIVNADTVIPTLYRYADEEFCVKILDSEGNLIQIFDLDLEGKVQAAIADTKAVQSELATEEQSKSQKANYAYKKIYNDQNKPYYLYGVPWLGNKENVKLRVDLFVKGKAGYINNIYVNYTPKESEDEDSVNKNFFYALKNGKEFYENFTSYSWSGETLTTEEGDVLVTGNSPKDKIVITYQIKK